MENIKQLPDGVGEEWLPIAENLMKRGEAKGEARGIQQKTIHMITRGHTLGFSIQDLALLSEISEDEVRKIIAAHS